MNRKLMVACIVCALVSIGCDAMGSRVGRESAERSRDASQLAGRKGGNGGAGTVTVTRGDNGYGYLVRAGGSVEHVTSGEAAALAVDKYKRDGYRYDGSVHER